MINPYYEVTDTLTSELNRFLYRFWLDGDLRLRLDRYAEQVRLTKRHKWKDVRDSVYDRLDSRGGGLRRRDIIIPSWVFNAILESARSDIRMYKEEVKK